MIRPTTPEIAWLLAKVVTPAELAPLLNGLLCVDQDSADRFTAREIELGQQLFDALCAASPEAVEIAQKGV